MKSNLTIEEINKIRAFVIEQNEEEDWAYALALQDEEETARFREEYDY